MPLFRSRFVALALALLLPVLSRAEEPGLRVPAAASPKSDEKELPVFITADHIEGVAGKQSLIEGNAELRKGTTKIRGDTIRYDAGTQNADAQGNVRVDRDRDVMTGPRLKYNTRDSTGLFENADFSIAPRARGVQLPGTLLPTDGRGHAEAAEMLGENRYELRDGFFTTCKPGNEDWRMETRVLDLNYTTQVGTAYGATVRFMDLPILATPYLTFSLDGQRKSGFLTPTFGVSGKSGPEVTTPYYFNLAPNYDLTVIPRYMEKRGLQLGDEFRYLGAGSNGIFKSEILPNDQSSGLTRSMTSFVYNARSGPIGVGLNLTKVSDDNYFRDLGSGIGQSAQTYLDREGSVSYGGSWWGTGSYSARAMVQAFQTLQDPNNPVAIPYARRPVLSLGANRGDFHGLDVNFSGEYVDFTNPTSVNGTRTTLYPSVSVPFILPSGYFTPKIGFHSTYYTLGNPTDGTPNTLQRNLPIYSLDSGVVFERDTNLGGRDFTQTLEPRAYYLRIPYRNQNLIPLFDTGQADFNFAQIFSENSFAGGDRINDANQLTLAVSSRLLIPSSGREAFKVMLGQRYYFRDQLVTLNSTDTPGAMVTSDWLASISGRVTNAWLVDSTVEHNPHQNNTQRMSASLRYQPGPFKTFSITYSFLRDPVNPINQIDPSAQWPLGGGWFGVARLNYSLISQQLIEGVAGIEYQRDCWIGRIAFQRYTLTLGSFTTAVFMQLELNGLSQLGMNPLETLKRNVPGYQRLNTFQPETGPGSRLDFYN